MSPRVGARSSRLPWAVGQTPLAFSRPWLPCQEPLGTGQSWCEEVKSQGTCVPASALRPRGQTARSAREFFVPGGAGRTWRRPPRSGVSALPFRGFLVALVADPGVSEISHLGDEQ